MKNKPIFTLKQKVWYSTVSVFPIYIAIFVCFYIALMFFIDYINYALIAMGILFLFAIYSWKLNRSFKYIITAENITHKYGILTTRTDFIELYRVKDYNYKQTIIDKMIGSMTLTLFTSDKTHSTFVLKGIPFSNALVEKIRDLVEENRRRKNVYEID